MIKKKKILIVHNYYQIPGGEDTVVANEEQLLKEYGHEVFFYSRKNSELKTMSKLQKIMLPFTSIFNIRTYIDIKQIIRSKNIEIVHVHNTLALISPSVYYAAKACKVPVIQTIHNFRLLCPGATFFREGHICEECITKGLKCAIKHNCYRESKIQTIVCVINMKLHRMMGIYRDFNYICLTEFNKSKLLSLKQVNQDKVFVKPNFVNSIGEFIPGTQRVNQFVFVGRLDKLKGIDILLKAWNRMGKAAPKLIVCGTGPMEKWCKQFITKTRSNVELRGYIPNKEARKLIAHSKALILPTQWYEGFPISIVEAYSVGTPVICTAIGNASSVVEEGITGWKFKDMAGLISAIENYEDICARTLENYKTKFAKDINYKKMMEIYEECQN
ncbi:MAG: glycosyltransferase family 4 protein [Clostridium sp.]|nr:glycosyltransferase family 4 protein [Clostridium sp.]MDU7706410.1 glycosyltransferase family 4 protein [Clostridium sp.]